MRHIYLPALAGTQKEWTHQGTVLTARIGPSTCVSSDNGTYGNIEITDSVAITYDGVHDELVVLADGYSALGTSEVMFFPRTATGTAAPTRDIGGTATLMFEGAGGLPTVTAMWVDLVNDEVFVTRKDGVILVFSRTANGNVAPLRTISGPSTKLVSPTGIVGCR
jgi:hypothetical protein